MKTLVFIIMSLTALAARAGEFTLKAGAANYRIQTTAAGAPPPSGYPVLYVLDGDAQFPIAAAAAANLAFGQKNTANSLLIVGIGYGADSPYHPAERARDYTPPSPDYRATGDKMNHEFGGAEQFRTLLETQIKPAIARQYPIDRQRQGIFGHSYGGLFALYTLSTRPGDYQNYYASSPSIWWNSRRIMQLLPENLPAGTALWLSNGEYEQTPPANASPQEIEKLKNRNMAGSAQAIARRYSAAYRLYLGETHQSVMPHALADAVLHMTQTPQAAQ